MADLTGTTEPRRGFYTALRASASQIVPVIGAGLAAAAGAPSFASLIEELLARARGTGAEVVDLTTAEPFKVIDTLAIRLGESWLQNEVGAFVAEQPLCPTPALYALSKARSGLVVTTNYDLAIEQAASKIGKTPRTLTLDDFDQALLPSGNDLRVLHLHGVATDPSTIVLSDETYRRIADDERVQQLLRTLAIQNRLVFLGHSLDPREEHLRRDLAWAAASAPSVEAGRHLLIADRESIDDPASQAMKTEIEAASGVQVILAPNPDGAYRATVRTAHAIAGPSLIGIEDVAQQVGDTEFDPHYVPLPVADATLISTPGGMGSHMARVFQHGDTFTTDLDQISSHLVLVAGGGYGKSEELRQIGRRTDGPSLLQPLTMFDVDDAWHDKDALFVAGMTSARSARDDTPRLTTERFRDESYTFLLDGLDEVPAARRPALLRLISEIAERHPQHRIVLASRPSVDLTPLGAEFERWAPLPDHSWLQTYLEQRAITIEALTAALPDTGDIADLIQIPIYAAAAAERIEAGEELPESALDLVIDLANRRLNADVRIPAEPSKVRTWLDRLALTMMLSASTQLSHDELRQVELASDLDPFPIDEQLAKLASRALLTEVDGSVSFPANVVREARAAAAILSAGDDGLDLIRAHVLIELNAVDANGTPIRTVRPDWVSTLELLLPLAPAAWRQAVATHDPELAARATASNAPTEERAAAIRTIWASANERLIWIESSRGGDGTSNEEALRRLLSHGTPDGFVADLIASTSHPERTVRGNAIRILQATDVADDELHPLVSNLIGDTDSVVRRFAALVAALRGYTDLVDLLVEQANRDPDSLARDTLTDSAIELAAQISTDRVYNVALKELNASRRRGIERLVVRQPRLELLKRLASPGGFDATLFDELVDEPLPRYAKKWTAEEVATLAHIVGMHPNDTHPSDVRRILLTHPAPAVLARLVHPMSDLGWWDVPVMLRPLTETQLIDLKSVLQAEEADGHPTPASLTEAGCPPGVPQLDPSARVATLTLVEEELRRRQQGGNAPVIPPAGPTAPAKTPEPEPMGNVVTDTDSWREALRRWNAYQDERDLARRLFEPSVAAELRAAAARADILSAEDCVELFRFLLDYDDDDLESWLAIGWSETATSAADQDLQDLTELQLTRLPHLLPGPWPDGLAIRVLDALEASKLRMGRAAAAAGALAERTGEDAVREWASRSAHPMWIDVALVRLGDCDAELRLITAAAREPLSVRRHPNAFDEDWVSDLRCPSSADALSALLRDALIAGTEPTELESVRLALTTTAGAEAPAIWDKLLSDEDIPGARFMYYDRRESVAKLVATSWPAPAVLDPAVSSVAVAMVPAAGSDAD